MKRKKILISITLFVLIISLTIFGRLIYNMFVGEGEDDMLMVHIREVSVQLHQFQKIHHAYPSSLKEAAISDKYCSFQCFTLQYTVSPYKDIFYLAGNANYPFVYFISSDCHITNKDMFCSYGSYGLVENYRGKDYHFPIYKKDKKYFSNPNIWPQLEKPFSFFADW